MKKTLTLSSLFVFGMVAVTLLISAPQPSMRSAAAPQITLKTAAVPSAVLLAGNGGGDGQESHGDKGRTHGG